MGSPTALVFSSDTLSDGWLSVLTSLKSWLVTSSYYSIRGYQLRKKYE